MIGKTEWNAGTGRSTADCLPARPETNTLQNLRLQLKNLEYRDIETEDSIRPINKWQHKIKLSNLKIRAKEFLKYQSQKSSQLGNYVNSTN